VNELYPLGKSLRLATLPRQMNLMQGDVETDDRYVKVLLRQKKRGPADAAPYVQPFSGTRKRLRRFPAKRFLAIIEQPFPFAHDVEEVRENGVVDAHLQSGGKRKKQK
jgi:hypothetical protein